MNTGSLVGDLNGCHKLPARSSVHIIIINLDRETDPRDVNVFPEFIDTQLQTAARLAHLMLIVRSMSARIKAIFISSRVRESTSLQSALYIRPP